MSVSLKLVDQKDKKILYNLYSLFLHDLSNYTNHLEIEKDGSFKMDTFDEIWKTEGLSPYFIYSEEKLVGFLLLLERPFLKKNYDYSINDLFILNSYRGKGIAIKALKSIFENKKGKYFVIELEENTPAVDFWKIVYHRLGIDYEEMEQIIDGDRVLIQTFDLSKEN